MRTNTLPGNTGIVLQKLSKLNFLQDFYLTGGTALSLQIGHRESQDLDFFAQEDFYSEELQRELEKLGNLESVELDRGTLNCFLDDVKLQFLQYPYPLLEEKITWENVLISSKLDIACTKLITAHILKSLVYFIDADIQPMPRMHEDVSWERVKEEIIKTAKGFKI